ncbi:hypothetical protein Hypma_004351 [Hypsizygus marmoreus]|uniref:Uncharacterized protein n=1 Tax=Hypsizygus marmoreus TaxID=39966 RepID=A0A369K646_HYPMA|nr:hypothetical protein Hypma_004351 [Hypsizygus marmoreus]
MSSNSEVLMEVGEDFVVKVARVVPGAICYGVYLVLIYFLAAVFYRHGLRSRASSFFLPLVTILMFFGGTIFLCLDVADLVRRMQVVLVNNPEQTFQQKLDEANESLKKLVWTGQMLFIFMLILGDSVVVWRTWAIFQGYRMWVVIPISTWLGSVIAAIFELGCHLHTHWAINDLSPHAKSVGAKRCADADLSSYTLSFVTNMFCTSLIAFKAWRHRRVMAKYLGSARRKTQVERILTLLMESGSVYLLLYTLQAVPIYGAQLTRSGLLAFNVVNAIIQQAMGMYPTAIIVLVKMQKSPWDATEVSQNVKSGLEFAHSEVSHPESDTTVSASQPGGATIAMVNLSNWKEPTHDKEPHSIV